MADRFFKPGMSIAEIKKVFPFAKHTNMVSVSRLQTFSDCTLKHDFKYKHKLKDSTKYYLTRGMVFHECMNEMLLDKSITLKQILEFAVEKWIEAKKAGLPVGDYKTKESDVLKQITTSLSIYYERLHTGLDSHYLFDYDMKNGKVVKTAEMEFRIPIVDIETMEDLGYDWDIYGAIDEFSWSSEYAVAVIDHKLHSRAYKDFAVDTSLQLGIYAYAIKYLWKSGCFPEIKEKQISKIKTGFNSFRTCSLSTNPKGIQFEFLKDSYDDAKIKATINIVAAKIKAIESGIVYPSFNDECTWKCGFNKPCQMLRNGKDISEYIKENRRVYDTEEKTSILSLVIDEEEAF